MRTQILDFKRFVSNEKITTDELLELLEDKRFTKMLSISGGLMLLLVPKSALAATKATADQTFSNLWHAVMNICGLDCGWGIRIRRGCLDVRPQAQSLGVDHRRLSWLHLSSARY